MNSNLHLTRAGAALVAGALALGSCSSGSSAGADDGAAPTVRAATLKPGDALPAVDEPVFVLDTPDGALAFDIETFEQLGTVEVVAFEPWFEADIAFEGVWATDVLAFAGVEGDAELWLHALDDYEVEIDVDDLTRGDALFATKAGGEPIAVADGGPIRLVFAEDDGIGRNSDYWIWNIDAGAVR